MGKAKQDSVNKVTAHHQFCMDTEQNFDDDGDAKLLTKLATVAGTATIANPKVKAKAVSDPFMNLKYNVHQVNPDSVHNKF